jgi:hypothetical protein
MTATDGVYGVRVNRQVRATALMSALEIRFPNPNPLRFLT